MFDSIIEKYFTKKSKGYNIYMTHVSAVADTVLKICDHNPSLIIDKELTYNAALLHDIGICMTNAPKIECYGFAPYIQHGILGRLILEDEGLPQYAKFCETHVGTGLFAEDIIRQKLPLPIKDMIPQTIEEEVLCYADKFFSKSHGDISKPEPFDKILREIKSHGEKGLHRFQLWIDRFGYEYIYT